MIIINKFNLTQSDGLTCSQVLSYNNNDLEYWKSEAKKTGHLMAFDHHVLENAFGYDDPEHDVYQIFPPEMADYFVNLKKIEL